MIKDLFLSFRDNFREKTTNPFLGTYLLVWIIRNWELVFSIFNFDKSHNLDFKTSFIRSYYEQNSFLLGILWNTLWTFGVLITTYIILNLSRAIVNISEKQIKPWVYKLTDSKSIVLKSIYERIRNDRDELQNRLDKERESRSKLEVRIKNLEEEIVGRDRAVAESEGEESVPDSSDINQDEFEKLYYRLQNDKLIDDFKIIAVKCRKSEYIDNNHPNIDRYLELGLIIYKNEHFRGGAKRYALTNDGNELLKTIRNIE